MVVTCEAELCWVAREGRKRGRCLGIEMETMDKYSWVPGESTDRFQLDARSVQDAACPGLIMTAKDWFVVADESVVAAADERAGQDLVVAVPSRRFSGRCAAGQETEEIVSDKDMTQNHSSDRRSRDCWRNRSKIKM